MRIDALGNILHLIKNAKHFFLDAVMPRGIKAKNSQTCSDSIYENNYSSAIRKMVQM